MNSKDFERFKSKGEQNRFFIRASDGEKLTGEQKEAVKDAKARSKAAYKALHDVQAEVEKRGYRFVIFKTLDNYPDMGKDTDFIIDGGIGGLVQVLMKKFGGRIKAQSIASDLAGKRSIEIDGSPVTFEFHARNFNQIGEYMLPGKQVIDRSRIVERYGMKFRVPSREDAILLDVIHRIYRHMGLRYSDVYNTKKTLDEGGLDWTYILKNAKETGILPGLVLFLDIVERYSGSKGNMEDFPYYLTKREFLSTYVPKVVSDVLQLRLRSTLRLVTIYPFLLVLQAAFGKTVLAEKIW